MYFIKTLNESCVDAGIDVPAYHEIWTWDEGDELPNYRNWNRLMQQTYHQPQITLDSLQHDIMNHPSFSPKGFFFLTHRSDIVGTVVNIYGNSKYQIDLNNIPEQDIGHILFPAIDTTNPDDGILKALIQLSIRFHAQNRKKVALLHCSITDVSTQNVFNELGFQVIHE